MRVAYIVNEATVTHGWGRYMVEVIKGMRAYGVDPVLVTASQHVDAALQSVEIHPILMPVLSHRLNTLRTFGHTLPLRRLLATCDLVHCGVELYAPLVALAKPAQMPFILNAHGTWAIRPLESSLSRMIFAPSFRRADVVLCLSEFTQAWMRRLIHLENDTVLTGGVTIADYDRPIQMTLPSWAQHNPVIFTAGAFKTRKGQHISLEAFALAQQHIPNLHYALAGNPEANPAYVQTLTARIAELGLSEQVHFLGVVSQDELVKWYQESVVFILTQVNDGSTFEGLGMVYLEAGAAQTPSIGSWNCGAEAAIIDGKSGFLVPQNDPTATAEALLTLLGDDDLRERMGQAAYAQAKRLSWANLCRRLNTIYAKSVAKGSSSHDKHG